MNRYKKVILELKEFPESQEVMDNPDWFPIVDGGSDIFDLVGDSAYARILDDSEYILVEKTTADEFNNDYISGNDPGDENEG